VSGPRKAVEPFSGAADSAAREAHRRIERMTENRVPKPPDSDFESIDFPQDIAVIAGGYGFVG